VGVSSKQAQQPRLKIPTFYDLYSMKSIPGQDCYLSWMVDNNPNASKQDLEDLKIKHIDKMYESIQQTTR
jgi:hypothetical protein